MSKRNVVHVEIPAANVEAAGRFYQELFGWKIDPMPAMNYTMWEAVYGGKVYKGRELDGKIDKMLMERLNTANSG